MWQVGATCYGTKTAALEASASTVSGTLVQHAGSAHLVTVSAVADNGVQYTLTPLSGGTPIIQQVLHEPMPCNLLTLADGQIVAWAIAAGWIAIYCIKLLLQAQHNDP